MNKEKRGDNMISREEFERKALEVLDEQKFLPKSKYDTEGKLFLEDDLSEFIVSDNSADMAFDDYIDLLYNKLIENYF